MARPTNKERDEKVLREIRKRHNEALERESENRDCAIEDLKFLYEENGQWQDDVLNKRKGRPNYTYNRVIGALNQVIGDQRQNKPSIKVRAVDSEADPKTAEVYSGLIRNIESNSDAETAYDTAFKFAAAGGFGLWRVLPEFTDDDSFDQDICIKRVANPFTAYCDPSANDFEKRDSNWWIIAERMSKDTFRQMYPKASLDNINIDDYDSQWFMDNEVRIAEYFRKTPVEKTLALLSDGRTVEYTKDIDQVKDELAALGIEIKRFRTVQSHVIEWMKVSGSEILEGPIKYNWKYIPIVPVYGRTINIDGEELYQGLIRHSKDPQRSYNYTRSTMIERVALTPKAPYMATPQQIKGHEEMWRQGNVKNFPYMLYNVDPDSPMAKPSREEPPDVPNAMIALAAQDADDIKATTGFFDAAIGRQSNETSGKAIIARDRQGDVGSFEFIDNLSKAIKFTGEILVDMIPQVYDTERQIRILGVDGKEDFVPINQTVVDEESGKEVKIHDLAQGKYDVAVSVGPSYTTQRQESADMLIQLAGQAQLVGQVASDLIVKNLDMPGADELEKRLRGVMIRQGVIKPEEDDKDIIEPPSEMEQVMQQLQQISAKLEVEEKQAKIADLAATTEERQIDAAVKAAEFIDSPGTPKTSVSVS